MIRQIIKIDEELCNGCGLCVSACHEAAIGIIDGKAKLLRDDYCDGLGNCLPVCPTNAIGFEEREALEFNEEEVLRNMERMKEEQNRIEEIKKPSESTPCGCPGARAMNLQQREEKADIGQQPETHKEVRTSNLRQWPVQIQLVPPNAPYFQDAHLLVAADCCAFAHGDFHQFMKNKVTLIGCPKLDDVDYSEKLSQIIQRNNLKSITVTRMEVPCCGGIVAYVKDAIIKSGKMIPWNVITISVDGNILED